MAKVLVIDDDAMTCDVLANRIEWMGHTCLVALSLMDGLKMAASTDGLDLVFLDVRLPDGNGLEALPSILNKSPSAEVIIITGLSDPDSAELAIKSGAWDYLQKPFNKGEVTLQVNRVLEYRSKTQQKVPVALRRGSIVGSSPGLNQCIDLVAQAAVSKGNVLITGETGTGKELFARAIHENSPREGKAFIVVDCTVLPEQLVESVLFGHEKGAFSGAHQSHSGLVKLADGGTLFLDEVGELVPSLQRSFLRVIEERRCLPVGGKKEIASDFRLVAATNRDLDQMVRDGEFRKDLLYRLKGIHIHLPPLRGRKDDIKEMAHFHVNRLCETYGIQNKAIAPEFLQTLIAYEWPGNVRELVHALEGAITADPANPVLFAKHLPSYLRAAVARGIFEVEALSDSKMPGPSFSGERLPTLKDLREQSIETLEREYLLELMAQTRGDVSQACQVSGLGRARLYEMLKKYGISRALAPST